MSNVSDAGNLPLRIFVFDSTRLRSHLFFRLLSTHPNLAPIYHPFLSAAMFGPEHLAQHLHHSEMRREELEVELKPLFGTDTYASARADMLQAFDDAERQGKMPIANEHWFNVWKKDVVLDVLRGAILHPNQLGQNPTHVPDEIFETLSPIILIRHPALSVTSIYRDALKMTKQRPGDEDFSLITTNRPLRLLHDYFVLAGKRPIVVDAEDILWRTESMIKNMCTSLGNHVDPTKFSEHWDPTPHAQIETMNPIVYMMTKNIHDSVGIQRPSTKAEPDIDVSFSQWNLEYGEHVAQQLKDIAEENMPHYEYLKAFKA